jgi:hypothetical protein
LNRCAGEAPIIAPAIHIVAANRAKRGKRTKYYAARLEYAVKRVYGRINVVDELQCLDNDNTIETIREVCSLR